MQQKGKEGAGWSEVHTLVERDRKEGREEEWQRRE